MVIFGALVFLIVGIIEYTLCDEGIQNRANETEFSRIGPVASPFFFLCHTPRQGEPPENLPKDVVVTFEVTGGKNLRDGYTPQTVYEILISSNVQMDAFLVTAVHSLTKTFIKKSHLHLPSSTSGTNSAGAVCTVLHSRISKRPSSKISFVWMSPPAETGCVLVLATASLQRRLLFKDLKLEEICEKDRFASLTLKNSMKFLSNETDGFIFKDDFEGTSFDPSIWFNWKGASMESDIPGVASFTDFPSGLETRPMDFRRADQLQFTLDSGNCKTKTKVKLFLGTTITGQHVSQQQVEPAKLKKTDSVLTPATATPSSPLNQEDIPGLGQQGVDVQDGTLFEDHAEDEISSDDLYANRKESSILQDEGTIGCQLWDEIDMLEVKEDSPTVHTKLVPNHFQKENICIKWESDDVNPDEKNSPICWQLDDVAVITKDALKGPIMDDFDPIDPVNWFFFPGGQVKESCNSEGNALLFESDSEGWLTTRQVNFFEGLRREDIILEGNFKPNDTSSGWNIEGRSDIPCRLFEDEIHFDEKGKICSPLFDARNVGIILVDAGISQCNGDGRGINISARVLENGKFLHSIFLQDLQKFFAFPLISEFQKEELSVCFEANSNNERGLWTVRSISFLPWMASEQEYFIQTQINLRCGFEESQVDIEVSANAGENWHSIHRRCLPGKCHGESQSLTPLEAVGLESGWSLLTIPLPNLALIPNARLRFRQIEPNVPRSRWAIDNVFIGNCSAGCHNRGRCQLDGSCNCQYGFKGPSCETPEVLNPFYISEPFTQDTKHSANILQMSGGSNSYQCSVLGRGSAAVFKADGDRFITTVDVNTTDAAFLQFHFYAGTVSDIGKCPGPDDENEAIYVHYSCSGGAHWNLLHTLNPNVYKEPSHVSIPLPPSARDVACRFQIWQAEHSGSQKDMWAIDDLTVTSHQFNTIELDFSDAKRTNQSLRFHLGRLGKFCTRQEGMVFDQSGNNGLARFLETKSINIGPSYMMQFDLVLGCETPDIVEDLNSTIVLEYSLNHGLQWKLVQRPCSPFKSGCSATFTRGSTYHVSEFNTWKRITTILPKHTWSPTTRLRLRQLETNDVGLIWAVDNLYVGHECNGLCSGHGRCTMSGCVCDDHFHGYKCLPHHKLHREIDADFNSEKDDISTYNFQVIGGSSVARAEGCGVVVSGNSLYFGSTGVRKFETDDINAVDLASISFYLVVGAGRGNRRTCRPEVNSGHHVSPSEELGFGSVVLEYSPDGGISWHLLREFLPSSYRIPKAFQMEFAEDFHLRIQTGADIIRFRIWQPDHGPYEQWAIDDVKIKSKRETQFMQSYSQEPSPQLPLWLSVSEHSMREYCRSGDEKVQVMESTDPIRLAMTNLITLEEDDIVSFEISVGCQKDIERSSPVRLEYSRDRGNTWHLVQKECLSMSPDCLRPTEPSIYHPGHYSPWTHVYLRVNQKLTDTAIYLRWIQENRDETTDGEFALRNIYIGSDCPRQCYGHGNCIAHGICKCHEDFSGKYCEISNTTNPRWLRDDFNGNKKSEFWDRIEGGQMSAGCGPRHHGKVLHFSGDRARFLTSKELDTRKIKYLVFNLQIGGHTKESHCERGLSPRDNVALEYSTNNALTWNLLREFEPRHTGNQDSAFFIPLPSKAKTKQTRFRWWQNSLKLYGSSVGRQAEWQIDNIMVLANETLLKNIEDEFESINDEWFLIVGGQILPEWNDRSSLLVFQGKNYPNYAETWDFDSSAATVVQFELYLDSEERKVSSEVHLEYSTDNGRNWKLVREHCVPQTGLHCLDCHSPTIYSSQTIKNWTRITVPLSNSDVMYEDVLDCVSE